MVNRATNDEFVGNNDGGRNLIQRTKSNLSSAAPSSVNDSSTVVAAELLQNNSTFGKSKFGVFGNTILFVSMACILGVSTFYYATTSSPAQVLQQGASASSGLKLNFACSKALTKMTGGNPDAEMTRKSCKKLYRGDCHDKDMIWSQRCATLCDKDCQLSADLVEQPVEHLNSHTKHPEHEKPKHIPSKQRWSREAHAFTDDASVPQDIKNKFCHHLYDLCTEDFLNKAGTTLLSPDKCCAKMKDEMRGCTRNDANCENWMYH